jgi:hypothetical protein
LRSLASYGEAVVALNKDPIFRKGTGAAFVDY